MANTAIATSRASNATNVKGANTSKPKGSKVTNVFAKYAETVVKSFVESDNRISAAEKTLLGAQASQLESLQTALKGCGKVSEETFNSFWRKPVEAQLIASGRYAEASIPVKMSGLKVAVLALTNGIKGVKDESLKVFVQRVRPILKAKGVMANSGKGRPEGAKGKPSTRATTVTPAVGVSNALADGTPAASNVTMPGDKNAPTPAPYSEQVKQACDLLAHRNAKRATMLEIIMERHADVFDVWAAKIIADAALTKPEASKAPTGDKPKA